MYSELSNKCILLLEKLIQIPSFSREEENTAKEIKRFLEDSGVKNIYSDHNNVWCFNEFYDSSKPTILLNSHHDTVKPNSGYTLDPFQPIKEDGKLYGLGSNDAGGPLVSLIGTFLHFYSKPNLAFNLCLACTAEEEISGPKGIESILSKIGKIDFVIVGEPTEMQPAVAEKGLIVLDCKAIGEAGHAARNEGKNAIYLALEDILWFKNYKFPKISPTLGEVQMSVTVIQAGSQHNVVPASCDFVVDIRVTDVYTHEEILSIIEENVHSEIKPRSTRLKSSSISLDHPFIKGMIEDGKKPFGSPTMSDQALIPYPSLKLGPGDSKRSHMANEFIYISEIEEAIPQYIKYLEKIL